jgi:hypothetical protein
MRPMPATKEAREAEIQRLRILLRKVHKSRAIGVAIDHAASENTVDFLEELDRAVMEASR